MNYKFKQCDLGTVGIKEILNLSDDALILAVKNLVKSERKIMHLVLLHIQEVDNRRLYLKLGHTSLYQYLTQQLGYAESAAYDRMQGARLLKSIPEISTKIEAGALNLSQLVKVSACLKQEKKEGKPVSMEVTRSLLKQIENKTKVETEVILANTFQYVPEQFQKVKPQNDGSVVLQVTLTKEQFEIFKQAQSLLSHQIPDLNIAETITYLAKAHCQNAQGKKSRDVNFRSRTNEKTTDDVTANYSTILTASTHSFVKEPLMKKPLQKRQNFRNYISIHLKRSLFQKANYSCEYVHAETQMKCCSKYQLQIDHLDPLALGGTDDSNNLRILCGAHNRHEAEQMKLIF